MEHCLVPCTKPEGLTFMEEQRTGPGVKALPSSSKKTDRPSEQIQCNAVCSTLYEAIKKTDDAFTMKFTFVIMAR